MNWKMRLTIAVWAAVLAAAPGSAHALDDASEGKRLATQWCASCHLVTPDQASASADAPPFLTIAKRSQEELDRLASFLANPAHMKPGTQMPNFSLSRQEIGDLVAYIRSLKP